MTPPKSKAAAAMSANQTLDCRNAGSRNESAGVTGRTRSAMPSVAITPANTMQTSVAGLLRRATQIEANVRAYGRIESHSSGLAPPRRRTIETRVPRKAAVVKATAMREFSRIAVQVAGAGSSLSYAGLDFPTNNAHGRTAVRLLDRVNRF